jgi:hypothetical protein
LLLVLTSIVIIGSESRGTHDHILLSHDSGIHADHSVYIQRTTRRYIPEDITLNELMLEEWDVSLVSAALRDMHGTEIQAEE